MKYKKIFSALVIFLISFAQTIAQISEGGIPESFKHSNIKAQKSIQCVFLPTVNNVSLLVLDSLKMAVDSFGPYDFGITLQARYNINNSGTWDTLNDGSRLWRFHLVSKTSYANYLIFDNFYLPEGAKLFVYSEDRRHILGAFTDINNNSYQTFALGPVKGESLILEYYEPMGVDTFPILSISSLVHSYKNVYESYEIHAIGISGTCHINVMCPEASGWCNQRRSVALIATLSSVPGHTAALCSGSLLTNERRDERPYFLTANHCLDGDVNNWMFFFNYQSNDCANPIVPPSRAFSIYGATLKANHPNTDFALLELLAKPHGSYNTYYNGWSNDANDMTNTGAIIHHPAGDIKKITLWEKVISLKVDYWKVKFTSGSTEGGSSGAPLFNSNGLVVGQNSHNNEKPVCDNDKRNWFGDFSRSWNNQSGSSNQLKPWLNPNSIPNTQIISMSGDEPCKASYYFENANDLHTSANISFLTGGLGTRTYNGVYNASGTIETGPNVIIQSGTNVEFYAETIILGDGFTPQAGSNFTLSPKPCLRGCGHGRSEDENYMVLNTDKSSQVSDNENKINNDEIIYNKIFNVSPNPNNGSFTLTLDTENNQATDIFVYDALGNTVYQASDVKSPINNIDISKEAKGIYLVRVQKGNEQFLKKVVKQ